MLTLKDRSAAVDRSAEAAAVTATVASMLAEIEAGGDAAVRKYSEQLDSWSPPSFRLTEEETERIVATVPGQALEDIRFAQAQVRGFAERQLASLHEFEAETLPGVWLGQKHLPIASVGAYIPGGRYPLTASAHMTIVTAKVAGVPRVAACTPPIRGEIPAATIAAMSLAGADEIYLLGGVQAIGTLALGTESVPPVDLIAGPGNAYVAEAKKQLYGRVGLDLFAGPTEILVLADETADPFTVAVDLLSQAEHGPDSPAVLITTSEPLARAAIAHVEEVLSGMPTKDMAEPAWRNHGEVHVASSLDEAYALVDERAFEHVEVLTADPRAALDRLRNYGSLFLGSLTTVSYGDKVIGTNHVLPTRGAARYTGGLWVGKYLKTVTYQEITDPASSALLGEVCGRASRVELFEGHARSGDIRAAAHTGASLEWTDHAFGGVRD